MIIGRRAVSAERPLGCCRPGWRAASTARSGGSTCGGRRKPISGYDNDTRCFIPVPQERADRSSRDDIAVNADGSTDIFFGPAPPAGRERNWVPTLPGRGWFPLFRLHAPKHAFFDRSWTLGDLEKA